MEDFAQFISIFQGKKVLHLRHKDADCVVLGSAYALSRCLPGDVGFVDGLKTTALDLADHLNLDYIIDPIRSAYDCTIIYDTKSLSMLGISLPSCYALFEHLESGGHRFASFQSELA